MMDRVKEKIRMGEECAQMLNGVCQQELDELAKAILHAITGRLPSAKRICW